MKFSTATIVATLFLVNHKTEAFVPASPSTQSHVSARTSTELNLFGLFKGAGTTKVKASEAAAKVVAPADATVLPTPTEEYVRSLFKLWNDALASEDPRLVAKRFAKNAVLLPTVSDVPRTDYEGIEEYFETFLKLKPLGEILQSNVHVGPGWAQDVGIYEFNMRATGKKVKARYSFVYIYEDDQWKVLHQHSSQMPEEVTPNDAPKLTKEQVANLFHLWNDALDTFDPEAVANRYTKKAVLLPTVSDIPRTTPEEIKDYFTLFLKSKPRGKILQSFVQFGPNWAKDVGTYEFTLRGDNNKIVRARYTFIYRFEDGQWKISHQHSSQMPEELMAAAAACQLQQATEKSEEQQIDDAKVLASKAVEVEEQGESKTQSQKKGSKTRAFLDKLGL